MKWCVKYFKPEAKKEKITENYINIFSKMFIKEIFSKNLSLQKFLAIWYLQKTADQFLILISTTDAAANRI